MTFAGLKVLQNRIERAKDRLNNQVAQNVLKEADFIEMRSRSDAPVDTGALKQSQYRNNEGTTRNLIVKIGFRVAYSPFQEFGTGKRFRLNAEYTEFGDFALKFKRSGIARPSVRPRRYFLHNYIIARRSLNRKTSTMMKNILK
jgi:hypothetical protein